MKKSFCDLCGLPARAIASVEHKVNTPRATDRLHVRYQLRIDFRRVRGLLEIGGEREADICDLCLAGQLAEVASTLVQDAKAAMDAEGDEAEHHVS